MRGGLGCESLVAHLPLVVVSVMKEAILQAVFARATQGRRGASGCSSVRDGPPTRGQTVGAGMLHPQHPQHPRNLKKTGVPPAAISLSDTLTCIGSPAESSRHRHHRRAQQPQWLRLPCHRAHSQSALSNKHGPYLEKQCKATCWSSRRRPGLATSMTSTRRQRLALTAQYPRRSPSLVSAHPRSTSARERTPPHRRLRRPGTGMAQAGSRQPLRAGLTHHTCSSRLHLGVGGSRDMAARVHHRQPGVTIAQGPSRRRRRRRDGIRQGLVWAGR